MRAIIHTDGASSGNPGPSGVGGVVNFKGKIYEIAEPIGIATNNIAEYTSLIMALELALELGVKEAEVYMDSELVVRQVLGVYKVKNEGLKPLYKQAHKLSIKFNKFSISHLPREENTEADRLSKKALEKVYDPKAGAGSPPQGALPF